jgi:spore cortex formation protein SpoVR/YcgB (stage V sporulation)
MTMQIRSRHPAVPTWHWPKLIKPGHQPVQPETSIEQAFNIQRAGADQYVQNPSLRFGKRVSAPILINRLDSTEASREVEKQRNLHPDLVQLNALRLELLKQMRQAGLNPMETDVYVVPEEAFLQMAARDGYQERYPHWSWGQEYFNLKLSRLYGKKTFQELVVANEPVHTYIPDTEPIYGKKALMLSALARADLYRNNIYFKKHRFEDNIQLFATHAAAIRRLSQQLTHAIQARANMELLTEISRQAGLSPELTRDYLDDKVSFMALESAITSQIEDEIKTQSQKLALNRQKIALFVREQTADKKSEKSVVTPEVGKVLQTALTHLAERLQIPLAKLYRYLGGEGRQGELGKASAMRIHAALDQIGHETGIPAEKIGRFMAGSISAEEVGTETVEEFLDSAHSVRNLVNIGQGRKPLTAIQEHPTRAIPESDVLGFLIKKGQHLHPWQRDILEIIRQETYAQLPKAKTQILADGWACLWNNRLNIRNPKLWELATVTREARWSAFKFRNDPVKVNSYQLGYVMFKHIEQDLRKRYENDLQRDDKVRDALLKIRAENYDVSFIRRYLTKAMAEELLLYNYGPNNPGPGGQRPGSKLYIQDEDFEAIRARLIEMYEHTGQPLIQIANANYRDEGALLLKHVYQYDLKKDYAKQTVTNLAKLWGHRVYLQTYITPENGDEPEPLLISSDGTTVLERNTLAEEN